MGRNNDNDDDNDDEDCSDTGHSTCLRLIPGGEVDEMERVRMEEENEEEEEEEEEEVGNVGRRRHPPPSLRVRPSASSSIRTFPQRSRISDWHPLSLLGTVLTGSEGGGIELAKRIARYAVERGVVEEEEEMEMMRGGVEKGVIKIE